MKKFILPFVLIIIFSCNSSTDEPGKSSVMSDLASEHLNGAITSYEETSYTPDSTGNIGEMDSCCVVTTHYNENGNAFKTVSKDSKGVEKEETTFERHPNGLWKSATTLKDGKSNTTFDTKMEDGKYTLAIGYDSTGKMETYYTGITQNDAGQVLTWKRYDKDSVFREEGEAKYENNLQTSFTGKDSVGKVKNTFTATYNDKGEQTETSNTNITKDSTTTKVTKFTYDSHDESGNWTQRTTLDDKGKATKVVKRTYMYAKKD